MERFCRKIFFQCQIVSLLVVFIVGQSSDFFSYVSQNVTNTIDDDDGLLIYDRVDKTAEGIYQNHSIHRRQVPLDIVTSERARIPIVPSYIILGPRTVRPAQLVALSITVLRDEWNPIMVKALISNEIGRAHV